MSALDQAWNDDDRVEPYADLDEDGRQGRDEAYAELLTDPVAAVHGVDVDDLDEMHALLSWVDDPAIWRKP